jgi:hypothetical protein
MRIICLNNNQDIGVVKRNTIKSFTFDLYNNSDRITSPALYPGCGCTSVKLTKPVLMPHEHSEVEVNFDANKNALGTWEKSIVVSYLDDEDLEQKNLQLLFTVTVEE